MKRCRNGEPLLRSTSRTAAVIATGDASPRNDDHKKPAATTATVTTATPTGSTETGRIQQSPHTLRLLKLIREGTAGHAEEAAGLLCSEPLSDGQLWDVAGRLLASLRSASWRTRAAAARALEGTALRVPVEEIDSFGSSASMMRDDETHFWTVPQLLLDVQDEMLGGCMLDQILEQGTLLLSRADGAEDGEDPGQQALEELDRSAGSSENFAEKRVRLQRRILAQRLGMEVLHDILGKDDAEDALLTETDIQSAEGQASGKKQPPTKPESKRQRRKRQQRRTTSDHDDTDDENDGSTSVRALLVLELQRQNLTNTNNTARASHTNPQVLLATELMMRLVHPAWHVRHGALLGIVSLLRAWWRKSPKEKTANTEKPDTSINFGPWPHDILTRCLCVLALDRFGDFSGAWTAPDASEVVVSGSVVAPVREMAGQVVALLVTAAPVEIQNATLRVLQRLAEYSAEWEVRHGALVALKFATAMAQTSLTGKESPGVPPHRWRTRCVEVAAKAAVRHLSDDSDDVKTESAQILKEVVVSGQAPAFVLRETPLPLWRALQDARSISSCLVDLASLLAAFVSHDCPAFLRALPSGPPDEENEESVSRRRVYSVAQLLLRLLESDFTSVRLSALQTIKAFVESVFSSALPNDEAATHEAFCLLVEHIFEFFIASSVDASGDGEQADEDLSSVQKLHNDVWQSITGVAGEVAIAMSKKNKASLEATLIFRYFCVDRPKRGGEAFDILGQTQSAEALSGFLYRFRGSSGISPLVEYALGAFFHSPSTFQCEGACLLYRSFCGFLHKGVSLERFATPLDREVSPLCLRINEETLAQDISHASVCDQAFLQCAPLVRNGTKQAHEAVRTVVQIWTETVLSRDSSERSTHSGKDASVESMRVQVTIAGAKLATGLPEKITPIVRALMTSLKNEFTSMSRQIQTCNYLVQLLQLIQRAPKLEKAQVKILTTLCDSATHEACLTEATAALHSPASRVLQSVVGNISSGHTLRDYAPLWTRLRALSSESTSHAEDSTIVDALHLLKIVCGGLTREHPLLHSIIDEYVPKLVRTACENSSDKIRIQAISILKVLCATEPHHLLKRAIPWVAQRLKTERQGAVRLSSCILLKELVSESSVEICPFVRYLLPLVMSLMTDPDQECSQNANHLFAFLVRVAPLVRLNSSAEIEVDGFDEHGNSVIDHLIFGKPLPPCTLPREVDDALKAGKVALRPYQIEGITWLRFLQTVSLNGALCDSMGVGKTVQALVSVALAHSDGGIGGKGSAPCSLVVCPATLVDHWIGEMERFFPGQTVFRPLCLVGNASFRRDLWKRMLPGTNVVVTSYGVLRSDVDLLSRKEWCYCILDEGHLLKNPKTATARASRRINARHKLILTGTPIQNSVHELWATFDFLMPNFLGTSKSFTKEFAGPITKGQLPGASASSIADGMAKLKTLHQQVLPFILRREKEAVLPDLPPKQLSTIFVPMSELQEKIYKSFCSRTEVIKSLDTFRRAVEENQSAGDSRGLLVNAEVLKSLLFLRLLCTHPSLVLPESIDVVRLDASGKMLALAELLAEAGIFTSPTSAADGDRSALYYEDDTDEPDSYTKVMDSQESVVGSVSIFGAPRNGSKTIRSKCLIFSQFTKSLDVVEGCLFKTLMPSLRYLRLDGSVSADRRVEIAEAFNRDENISVLLLTTRVGGLGLNLTGADVVIFLESDYNPFADLQAMDRAHRIGQSRTVNVYRIITKESIEEKILALQEKKVATSNAIVNTDNSRVYSMGTDRLLDIFTFRNDQDGRQEEDANIDYDLDGLVERCAEDYTSLSVDEFMRSFEQVC